jgi:hypothetical protein
VSQRRKQMLGNLDLSRAYAVRTVHRSASPLGHAPGGWRRAGVLYAAEHTSWSTARNPRPSVEAFTTDAFQILYIGPSGRLGIAARKRRKPRGCGASVTWARRVSNLRPLACEGRGRSGRNTRERRRTRGIGATARRAGCAPDDGRYGHRGRSQCPTTDREPRAATILRLGDRIPSGMSDILRDVGVLARASSVGRAAGTARPINT